jgi:segregation and condensation protein A
VTLEDLACFGTGGPEDASPLLRRPAYEVKLEAFEGPLDLLLHLIREHEIDIYDIPIAQITEQYLEYLNFIESLDLALAGEFLEMAATLIRIKVQMLLPSQEEQDEEEDPRGQLIRKLVEYKKMKEAARSLSDKEEDRRRFFPRGVDPRDLQDVDDEQETEEFLRDVTLFDLVDALRDVLSRVPARIDVHAVDLETTTVEEQMERIRSALGRSGPTLFSDLFAPASTRVEIVTTFVALLELIRLGIVVATQKHTFGAIALELKVEEEH